MLNTQYTTKMDDTIVKEVRFINPEGNTVYFNVLVKEDTTDYEIEDHLVFGRWDVCRVISIEYTREEYDYDLTEI